MTTIRNFFMAASAIFFASSAPGMEFHAAPPVLHLSGRVVDSDWAAWKDAMSEFDGKIQYVVFHHSPGGDSRTGRSIGQEIRKRGFKTVVAGRCVSACANMFLGGVERYFSATLNERPKTLGFHGSYSKSTGEMNKRRSGDYFVQMTDGKMDEAFVERFIRLEKRSGMLYLVHPSQRREGADQALAYLCQGDEHKERRAEECENLKEADALSMGVVTTWDAVKVDTPTMKRTVSGTIRNW